jgi:hypothetical protein
MICLRNRSTAHVVDSNFLAAITIVAVIIAFLGAVQLTFQAEISLAIQQVNKSINGSYRNFLAITDSERTIITLLIGINRSLTNMIEQDVNLTKAETEKLVDDLGTIPSIALSVNKTLEEIESKQPESNFTAQKLATERIENITKDIAQIKEALHINQTTQ